MPNTSEILAHVACDEAGDVSDRIRAIGQAENRELAKSLESLGDYPELLAEKTARCQSI